MKTGYSFVLSLTLLACSCTTKPDYDATGIFEATTVTVSSETTGRILEIGVSEGDSVAASQKIALVDTAMLALQKKQIMSQRESAESLSPDISVQVSALRSRIEHQRSETERQRRLLSAGATTARQYDDAVAALRTLQDQLDAQLSSLGKNRSSISDNALALQYKREQVEDMIARSVIVAPLTGTVLEKYAEPGEFAVPGKPLLKIADLGKIYLRSYFTASRLADIRIGQKVTVIADFGRGEKFEYPGTITWIAQESEFTPKSIQTEDSRANLVYAVKIAVKNDGRLKLGQYGEVRL